MGRAVSARRPPTLRWLRRASLATFVLAAILVVAITDAALVVANPGHRVGPVRPATPPVGPDAELPAVP